MIHSAGWFLRRAAAESVKKLPRKGHKSVRLDPSLDSPRPKSGEGRNCTVSGRQISC
jgi:hypothetical protein